MEMICHFFKAVTQDRAKGKSCHTLHKLQLSSDLPLNHWHLWVPGTWEINDSSCEKTKGTKKRKKNNPCQLPYPGREGSQHPGGCGCEKWKVMALVLGSWLHVSPCLSLCLEVWVVWIGFAVFRRLPKKESGFYNSQGPAQIQIHPNQTAIPGMLVNSKKHTWSFAWARSMLGP